jgi:hypothetical protein
MIIFYLLSLIFYLLACEQPGGPGAYGPVETVPQTPLPSTPENATGIAILSPPDTTYYAKGQPFERTGLAVGWLLDDGTTGDVLSEDRYTLEEPDMDKPGPKRVYVRAGDYPSVSFNILVSSSDSVLASVTVSGPAKKTQEFGKEFNKAGLAVTGHFSDGTTQNLASVAAIVGYDKFKRGPQAASVKVNQFTQPLEGITTRIGEGATVAVNSFNRTWVSNPQAENLKGTYIKGEPFDPAKSNIRLFVSPSGGAVYGDSITLSLGNELTGADFDTFTGFDPATPGDQTPTITVDGRTLDIALHVIDVEPAVWFDYGYMRHAGDTGGKGPGVGVYYAKPNETLVIAPVRYLIGYNADNTNAAGTTYNWTVSGSNRTIAYSGAGNERLHITPGAAGEYTIEVKVTGKSFVGGAGFTAGTNIDRTATAKLVCYDTALSPGTFKSPLKNFGAGQMSEGGTGYGWSLGSAGGYEVWTVEHRPSYKIEGNPFGTWHEAGVVWMQEDRNGNGLPDETWYELRGGDDDDGTWQNYITRRYAITYINGSVHTSTNEYQQIIRDVYWADAKGRSGLIRGGFPYPWGVTGNNAIGDWVTYTGTLLRDDGNIATGQYSGLGPMTGYVDALGVDFPVNKAMDLAGNPVNLTAVKFIRVQTSVFRYGGSFGDVSTEIQYADFLGTQSLFDKPE